MLQRIELKRYPEVKAVIVAAFPNYRKTTAFLSEFGSYGVSINSFWDSGSRAEFAVVELATGRRKALPTSTHPYFDLHGVTGETAAVEVVRGLATLKLLPEGFALVEAGIASGKAATAHVYVNPANLTKFLAA